MKAHSTWKQSSTFPRILTIWASKYLRTISSISCAGRICSLFTGAITGSVGGSWWTVGRGDLNYLSIQEPNENSGHFHIQAFTNFILGSLVFCGTHKGNVTRWFLYKRLIILSLWKQSQTRPFPTPILRSKFKIRVNYYSLKQFTQNN